MSDLHVHSYRRGIKPVPVTVNNRPMVLGLAVCQCEATRAIDLFSKQQWKEYVDTLQRGKGGYERTTNVTSDVPEGSLTETQ